jgi:hypothetical protein
MLTIETDRIVIYNNQEFKVLEGGEFAETELIPIYLSDDPEKKSMYALQAYWILNNKNFGEE